MNSFYRITVSVRTDGAAQIKQLENSLRQVHSVAGTASRGLGSLFGRGLAQGFKGLEDLGKNLQWAGRQLEFRFTLPLVAAGVAASKFALDNEAAMTRLRKVYGSLTMPVGQVRKEVSQLGRAFEVLSNIFGVAQKDVINIGADWAQAGASGIAVAKATRLTLEAMILGEIEAKEATEALIATQAAWGLNTDQLHDALAVLNIVENETGVSMGGLIDAFARASGTARTAGVDIQHLAAMVAAITPAAGSAAQAGNAIKTILSRVLAPTKQAAEVMNLMGLNIKSTAWQSKNGTQRIEEMADAFVGLTQPQQVLVSSLIGTRFQISKFGEMMRSVAGDAGFYKKALEAAGVGLEDNKAKTRNNIQYQRELGQVLASQPQAFKILWTQMQNALARVIVPLLPAMLALASRVVRMVDAFTRLSPRVQQLVLGGLAFLAVLGPLIAYTGAFALAISQMGKAFVWFFLGSNGTKAAMARLGTSLLALTDAFTPVGAGLVALGDLFVRFWNLITTGSFTSAKSRAAAAEAAAAAEVEATAVATAAYEAAWMSAYREATVGASYAAAYQAAAAEGAAAANTAAAGQTAAAWTAASTRAFTSWLFGAANMFSSAGAIGAAHTGAAALSAGAWKTAGTVIETTAIETTGVAIAAAETASVGISAALVAGIAVAVIAVAAVVYHFRKQIGGAFQSMVQWIANSVGQLPRIFAQVFVALVGVVSRAVKIVREWLSYLNPFARHSPSLVEEVIRGVDLIASKYASLSRIGGTFRGAVSQMQAFKQATKGVADALAALKTSEDKKAILAIDPSVGPAVDAQLAAIHSLEDALEAVGREYFKQSQVVSEWKSKLDAANDALERQVAILDTLRERAELADEALRNAKDTLDALARTPIEGMRAMNDQIFANEMAQKKLRLEILKMEQAGQSVDDLRNRFAMLQGQIELLTAEREDLRRAGAGSDITGAIDSQIQQMIDAQDAIGTDFSAYDALKAQLDELQRQGEILNLTYSVTFDPLVRQLDDVTNAVKEMPFEKLLADLTAQQGVVDRLTAEWEQADAAVKSQEAVVRDLTAARDAVQKSYDAELEKLDLLGAAYDGIERQIHDMVAALDDLVSAAKSLKDAQDSGVAEDFAAAGMGDFEDPGGIAPAGLGREEGDIDLLTDKWLKDMNKMFGNLDMLKPFKDMWSNAFQWILDHGVEIGIGVVTAALLVIFGPEVIGVAAAAAIGALAAALSKPIWEGLKKAWHWAQQQFGPLVGRLGDALAPFLGPIKNAFSALGDVAEPVLNAIGDALETVWDIMAEVAGFIVDTLVNGLGPAFVTLGDIFDDVFHGIAVALKWAWEHVIEPVFGYFEWQIKNVILPILDVLFTVWKTEWKIVGDFLKATWDHLIKPVWDIIYQVITTALVPVFQMFRAVAEIVFVAIGAAVTAMWLGVVKPTWDLLVWTIQNVLAPVFNWLWQNVVEPVFKGIAGTINWAWNAVISPVLGAIKWAVETVVAPVFEWLLGVVTNIWDKITGVIRGAVNIAIDIFNALAGGVNWIAEKLGLKVRVDLIPHVGAGYKGGDGGTQGSGDYRQYGMATGGVVGPGFKTNGVRAIVGEGNPAYPEWVIPTDPRYRGNAVRLFEEVGGELGMFAKGGVIGRDGIPRFGVGGIIDAVVGIVREARRAAATIAFAPFLATANALLSKIPSPIVRDIAHGMINAVYNWVKGDGGAIDAPISPNALPGALTPLGTARNPLSPTGSGAGIESLSATGAALGAYVRHRPGGVLVRVGEGSRDEIITPLPNGLNPTRNQNQPKVFNFYGDLEFPNIRSGDDAEKFVRNLESLAS